MSKQTQLWLVFLSVLAWVVGPLVNAEELRVDAPVIAVEPVTAPAPPVCDVAEPPRSAGLAAVLEWDLRGRCRQSEGPRIVTGYAVEYEWDGRRFTTVLDEPPDGETLALRLRLD